jgi:hypothetical protein
MSRAAYVLIFRQSGLMVCRHTQHDWKVLQQQYADYTTSLGVWTWREVTEFLAEEYPSLWPAWQLQLQPLIAKSVDVVLLG